MKRKLRLGTRGSALATAQSGHVAQAITQATGLEVELVLIKTRGDVITDRPLELVGGKGLFTKEIEQSLIDGAVDLAVHSMKDLPGEAPEGLVIAAVPPREDARDVIVGGRLRDLATGAVIGTGSARRRLQLRALRPDLDIRGIRGNVDTRIGKQRSGEYAAIVLAAAGMARLGRLEEIDDFLPIEAMIPAPGQGALAVQCRASDAEVRSVLASIHDFRTAVCTMAERAFLIELSGGCSVPAACYARLVENGGIEVLGFFERDGEGVREVIRGEAEDAEAIGQEMARRLRG